MNGDLLYVWNAPTYVIKFYISNCSIPTALQSVPVKVFYALEPEETTAPILPTITACKGTAFFRITQHYISL